MIPQTIEKKAKVAVFQLSLSGTTEEREETVEKWVEELKQGQFNPDFVILPELWRVGFFDYDSYAGMAEEMNGPTFIAAKTISKRLNCYTISGSFIEQKEGKMFNTACLIGRKGEIIGKYSKMHLFGYESKETEILTPGKETGVFLTEFGKIGIATCYDLRFPEQFRAMVDKGAEAFFIVSAWPKARKEHWRLFNQVRAVENQSYLISCNCTGTQNDVECGASSMVIAPDGTIVMEAADEEAVYRNVIDFQEVLKYRQSFPALHDRIKIQ